MRYCIGVKVVNRKHEIEEGLFAYGEYGFPCILMSDTTDDHKYKIPVFSDIKEAEHFVKELSRAYRIEFHSRAKRYNLDISQFRFFLIKVDSLKFERKLIEEFPIKSNSKYHSKKLYSTSLKSSFLKDETK